MELVGNVVCDGRPEVGQEKNPKVFINPLESPMHLFDVFCRLKERSGYVTNMGGG